MNKIYLFPNINRDHPITTWLLCLFFFGVSTFMSAQQNEYYYYYGSEQQTLELNTDYLYLIFNNDLATESELEKALGGEIEVEHFGQDNAKNSLIVLPNRQNETTSNWAKVKLKMPLKKTEYFKYLNTVKRNDFIQWVSPFYNDRDGNPVSTSSYFYVKLKDDKSFDILDQFARKNKASIIGQNKFMPLWYTVRCDQDASVSTLTMANTFYESGLFAHAEPAMVVGNLAFCVNDPEFSDQWGWDNTGQNGGTSGIDVNACAAWQISQGSRDIVVSVLDHGFEMNHPDLAGNTFGTGYNTMTGTSPSAVLGSHGTACAGIVGAIQNNTTGVSGIAPSLQLMSVSQSLWGVGTTSQNQLADGINWSWMNGADVISNSWGHNGLSSTIIDNAITNALNNGRGGLGTVVVFATGNSNGSIIYPASSNPDIVAVGAMSGCGERKNPSSCDGEGWGSCFGSELDVVAPGVLIPTTDRQGSAGYDPSDYAPAFNGTSSATPAVAGIAGLILSINPCLTHDEVEDMLESTAQKVGSYSYTTTTGRPNGTWNNEMGYGLIDAHAAVIAAQLSLSPGNNFDLVVKDRPYDTGVEPNPDMGPMWISDDIWVRQNLDGGTSHQNPEYKKYSPNGIYVRVTNNGNSTSPCANLAVYYSKASTGLVWTTHWDNYNIGGTQYGDLVNTVSIPEIPPSGTYIAEIPWYPPNPADFSTDKHHFCLLARILSPGDPMYFELTSINVNPNVRNNNNIAWKNVSVYNSNISNSPVSVYLRPVNFEVNWVNIRFFDTGFGEDIDFPFFDRGGVVRLQVEPELFERILQAEMQEVEIAEENTLLIHSREARINNLMLNEGENFAMDFSFELNEIQDGEDVILDLVQQNAETLEFEGGERFIIRGNAEGLPRTSLDMAKNKATFAYPNPTQGVINVDYTVDEINTPVEIRIQSITGKLVKQIKLGEMTKGDYTQVMDVSTLESGIYFIRLQVGTEMQTQKLVINVGR